MGINPADIISTPQYLGMIKGVVTHRKGKRTILKKEVIIKNFLDKSDPPASNAKF